ncbi:MAG: hypothetical protein O9340_13935 [Cyclobacteriaceae bacterium]|nr:hypothetical protein [Cyclobacteriaceae bacterium]
MKNLLVIFIVLFTHASAWCAVRTVSNNPTRPAQFSTIDAAMTASAAGDTIYVLGSPFAYPSITISKRLVLIGSGYNPNNQYGQATTISSITFFRDAGVNNPSGSVITGFNVTSTIILSSSSLAATNNVRLFRNRLSTLILYAGSFFCDGWLIYNNVISSYIDGGANSRTSPSATNILIANNILDDLYIYRFNSNTILVDHNLFLGDGSSGNIWNTYNAIFTNNIFVRTSGTIYAASTAGPVFCTFNNNLSNQTTISAAGSFSPTNDFIATFLGAGGGSNTGGGNFIGVDPLFESVSNLNAYVNNANYRLRSTSIYRNAGTDNTDLGIYGGAYPFPSGGTPGSIYDTSPMPPIPQISELNIQNASVPVNGTLNVNVKARINN